MVMPHHDHQANLPVANGPSNGVTSLDPSIKTQGVREARLTTRQSIKLACAVTAKGVNVIKGMSEATVTCSFRLASSRLLCTSCSSCSRLSRAAWAFSSALVAADLAWLWACSHHRQHLGFEVATAHAAAGNATRTAHTLSKASTDTLPWWMMETHQRGKAVTRGDCPAEWVTLARGDGAQKHAVAGPALHSQGRACFTAGWGHEA